MYFLQMPNFSTYWMCIKYVEIHYFLGNIFGRVEIIKVDGNSFEIVRNGYSSIPNLSLRRESKNKKKQKARFYPTGD